MYVYIKSESLLWTTGFYDPSGNWHADKDYDNPDDAGERCHYLNGGEVPDTMAQNVAIYCPKE